MRRVCIAAFVVAASTALLNVELRNVSAQTVFRVHTWNVARGHPAYQDSGQFDATILHAVSLWNTYPGWQLTLNEVCLNQAARIALHLGLAFYHDRYEQPAGTVSSACPLVWDGQAWVGSGPYGNATFAIGGYIGPNVYIFPEQGATEPKRVSCITMQSMGFKTANCSLHLTPNGKVCGTPWAPPTDTTLAQAGRAHARTKAWALPWGSLPIVAGDFNLPFCGDFSQMPPNFRYWYDGTPSGTPPGQDGYTHSEAWVPNAWRRTWQRYPTNACTGLMDDRCLMIDYLWAKRPEFRQHGRYECIWPGGVGVQSDHAFCSGVFRTQ